ncbi:MAG: RDD family protein [Gemmatimonadetes bacterium]|nr:RDD family protein [Gemmatimonadota bacterium]MXZ10396.1 RDD family protein [Gemmatimonadota bacterium]MYB57344.1 RDD family protein [Gemmatimonadota bacterium]MYD59492.1 RDD family protein [Gemmatimonadota bacterium]MYF16616.1 RDD family protein [Gemmatimonadota bacterium]
MLMQSEIAGIGRRLLATVLDFLILHLVLTVVLRNMLLSPAGVWMVDFIFIVIYSAIFVGVMGQTPGKMLLGLRVIDAQGGGLNYVQTFRRAVVKWAPVFVLFIVMALLTPEELYQSPADGEVMDTVEVDAQSAVASSTAMVIGTVVWVVLIHIARRHPDGQGIHDRVAETFVIRTG